jgi:DMSO/TMAO reductase YedYZ molybdopterin-dependent catalytic subunit
MKNYFHSKPALTLYLCLSVSLFAYTQTPTLKVEGEVEKPLSLTETDFARLPRTEVKGKDKDGKEHTFSGVTLTELLKQAGAPSGGQLRGKNLAKYLLAEATDGYKAIFALPELDPEFTEQIIIVADKVDGNPLPKGEGPFRLVVPKDKKHARWIREIVSVRVLSAKE